jgi:MSHA biogenesis protein MshP
MKDQFSCALCAARHSGERGFSLISAIVILVVLAVLGVAVVTVSTNQQRGAVADVLGARAYAAARAGMEWGMYQLSNSNGFGSTGLPNSRTCPPSPTSFALPASAPTLSSFTVKVTCTKIPDPNNDSGATVYQIDSIACNVPVAGSCPGTLGINYVERYVRVFM